MNKSDVKELFEQTLICAVAAVVVFHLHSVFEKPENVAHTPEKSQTEQVDSLSRDSIITAFDTIKQRAIQKPVKTR